MLKQRIITAIILAVGAIWALFKASPDIWAVLLLGIGLIAAWEWAGFAKITSLWQKALYAIFITMTSYAGIEFLNDEAIIGSTALEALVLIAVVSAYQYFKGESKPSSMGLILLFGGLFISLFVITMILFRAHFSAEALLMSLVVIWAIDTGAYFSGRKFGRKKLAQYVSPGKTWEGVYGGAILAFVVAIIGLYILQPTLNVHFALFALMAALIALFSVFGDLFESVLKRQVGLKDSGSILPGHGGVLDRIDSLIIAVPMFYILWTYGSVLA
ncbi:MAG: phosphatidate cytidylyltransferase [Thiotrichales bacterium]|nr:phosphatidate cytidylyltransferase [Thiotrichales bacterium]